MNDVAAKRIDPHATTCTCLRCAVATKLWLAIKAAHQPVDDAGTVTIHFETVAGALARVVGDLCIVEGQTLERSTELAEFFADQLQGWIECRSQQQGATPAPAHLQ